MALGEELERAAAAAAAHGPVGAVLAAETVSGERLYLVALGEGDEREWLVVDASGAAVAERERVREVASIVALCELAVELATAGRGPEAEPGTPPPPGSLAPAVGEARAGLEAAIGPPPRVASTEYLDLVGEAARRLERALGAADSPLATALAAHSSAVEGFVGEVESRNRVSLR